MSKQGVYRKGDYREQKPIRIKFWELKRLWKRILAATTLAEKVNNPIKLRKLLAKSF